MSPEFDLSEHAELIAPRRQLLCLLLASTALGDWDRLDRVLHLTDMLEIPSGDVLEILLQAHLFAGFPRAIEALDRWHRIARTDTESARASAPHDLPWDDRRTLGEALFRRIYDQHANRVLRQLELLGGPLRDWILEHAYGRVLARPGVPPLERELAAVTALLVTNCPKQLASHMRGALRCGASRDEVRGAILLGRFFGMTRTEEDGLRAFDAIGG